jgi:hypothetical protein
MLLWALLVLLAPVAAAAPVWAQQEDGGGADETSAVERLPCALGDEKGRIIIESSPDCERRWCARWTNVRVIGPGSRRLLTTQQDYSQRDSPAPLDVQCKDGAVVISPRSSTPPGLSLRLVYDSKRRTLALPPELTQPIAAGFDVPPSPQRLTLFRAASQAFRVLLEPRREAPALPAAESSRAPAATAAAPQSLPAPLNHIVGLDDRARERTELLLAQECIRGGQWLEATEILEAVGEQRVRFTAASQARRRKLLAELSRLRAQTRPLDLAERRRIGRALALQATPLDPGKRATLFWRREDLCVVQEEDPPRFMKCYQPALRQWGARVPVAWPKVDGQILEPPSAATGDGCSAPQSQETGIKGDRRDTDCWFDPNDIVGLLDGPALLLSGPRLAPKDQSAAPIGADRAQALIADSSGTRAVGQGCCWLEPEQNRLVDMIDGQKSWDLIGAPPASETWTGSPLASPDQTWIAIQSRSTGPEVRIWLLRVSHRKR